MLYMLECRIEEREEKEIAESNKSQYTASPHYAFCGIVIDLYILTLLFTASEQNINNAVRIYHSLQKSVILMSDLRLIVQCAVYQKLPSGLENPRGHEAGTQ